MTFGSVYQGMTSDELEKLASAGDTIAAGVLKQREESQKNYAAMTGQLETPERHRMSVFPQAYIEITGVKEIIDQLKGIRKEIHTMNEVLKRRSK